MSVLCKWNIQIVQFWLDGAGLSLFVEKQNQGFPAMFDSYDIKMWGIAQEA